MSNANVANTNGVAVNGGNNIEKDEDKAVNELFGNPVRKHLYAYPGITEEIIDNIVSKDIKVRDLSALNKKDLSLFGIEDEETQQRIIDDFSSRLQQEINISKYLINLNEKEYKEKVYRNIFEHLEAIRITLAACQLKMKRQPIEENVLVTPDTYASTITVKALQQVSNTAKDIRSMLNRNKNTKSSQWVQWIAGGSVILGCLAIYKCILKK